MSAILSAVQPAFDMPESEIRLAVEGYASEMELIGRAEAKFGTWYADTYCELFSDDHDLREMLCATFVGRYLSMAHELGHLPEGGAA